MLRRIAIVGGGLAGLLTAYWIKRRNPKIEIDVFERKKLEKYRVECAEALINQRKSFELAGELVKPFIRNKLRKVRWVFELGGEKLSSTIFYSNEFCWMLDRTAFQKDLIEKAGANVHFGEKVDPEQLSEYDIVVDARGSRKNEYCGLGVYKILQGDFSSIRDTNICEMKEDEPGTLYWVFPLDKNLANIGCGGERVRMKNLNSYIRELSESLEIEREVKRGAGLLDYSYAAMLYLGKEKVVAEGKLVRIGDAAGLVDPFTGEGMSGAISSAYWFAASLSDKNYIEKYIQHIRRENAFLKKNMEAALARKFNFRGFVKFMTIINGVNGKYLGSKLFPLRYPLKFIKILLS